MIKVIGDRPLLATPAGQPASQIATLFPQAQVLVTLPGIHATQRAAYVDWLNQQRQRDGVAALSDDEEAAEWDRAVDLIMDGPTILIRPDPDHMDLAFAADELLQEIVPKRDIKFLFVVNTKVRQAIQRRGEAWRIHPLPQSASDLACMIGSRRLGIEGRPIYYYNAATGTRWLTYANFASLGALDDGQLQQHLAEIARFSVLTNPRGRPEIEFFMARGVFGLAERTAMLNPGDAGGLRVVYEALRRKFEEAVPADFQHDDPTDPVWRKPMYCALIDHGDELATEESLLGLSSEFFMQVHWLPGARLEDGELIFDSEIDQTGVAGQGDRGTPIGDQVRGLICNLMQEYGDLEYVNIGCVVGSLSQRPPLHGRREVFLAQIKQPHTDHEILQIIRMQKWGVSERLDKGQDLLEAMVGSEEYTEYILDRRLGCLQLGMRLAPRIFTRKLTERYCGKQTRLAGTTIWSPYFQRDYISGIATDKMPAGKLRNPAYAAALAEMLGQAAAPNIIVGRSDPEGRIIFDDGDEIVIEDAAGMPQRIIVADGTGTFNEYRGELGDVATAYAGAVTRRWEALADPRGFAEVYLGAFVRRFLQIQEEYRKRRRAYDTLFKHRRYDPGGSFACRWQCVLKRLDGADPRELADHMRRHMPRWPTAAPASVPAG